jgi:putative radical SAM enzyme (TIGR03279 family)
MLGNPDAVPIKPILKRFAARGIRFHAQAVICPGINDGDKLAETAAFLKSLYPAAMSLAVVPVGLTGHREGLFDLRPVTKELAGQIVKEVEKWQKECLNKMGTRFVFAADELYIKAGMALPAVETYEAFDQIENGVGLVAKFFSEADDALKAMPQTDAHVSIVTGEDAAPFFRAFAEKIRMHGVKLDVHMAKNLTFGGGVSVSGLLAGGDIVSALRGKPVGQAVFISSATLRDGNTFLDDMTVEQLQSTLGVPVYAADDAEHFIRQMTNLK